MAITLNLSASAHLNKSLKIDAIRFLAAIWVLMYHFRPPAFKELLPHRLVAAETATPSKAGVWSKLAALGAWSYSLYLCHKMALALLEMTGFDETSRFAWFIQVALAFAISYGFYRMIERPSHLISQRLRKYTANAPAAPAA